MGLIDVQKAITQMAQTFAEANIIGAEVEIRLSGPDFARAQADLTSLGVTLGAKQNALTGEHLGTKFIIWRQVA